MYTHDTCTPPPPPRARARTRAHTYPAAVTTSAATETVTHTVGDSAAQKIVTDITENSDDDVIETWDDGDDEQSWIG